MSIPADADLYEAAVYGFLADWKFEGRWSNWQANASFRSGIEQAYRKKQSESEIPLKFEEATESAAEIVDEGATEEEYDLDRDANEDQAAVYVPGYTFNPDELAESGVAIKEEHDPLNIDTHPIAWPDFIFNVGRDAAEEAEMEQDIRTNHISDGLPSLDDDEAFTTGFVSQLLDFVNTQSSELATSTHEASNVPPTDHSDWLNDLESGGWILRNYYPLGARRAGWWAESTTNQRFQKECEGANRSNKIVERSLASQHAGSQAGDTERTHKILYEHAWTGM